MDASADRPAWTDLHEQIARALAASRLHRRLHDPGRILIDAAVDDLLTTLSASGFVTATETPTLVATPNSPDPHP